MSKQSDEINAWLRAKRPRPAPPPDAPAPPTAGSADGGAHGPPAPPKFDMNVYLREQAGR